MSTYTQIFKDGARRPPRTMDVPLSAFADTWEGKPKGDEAVKIGLRTISALEIEGAYSEAAKAAWRLHPEEQDVDERNRAYNESLITWVVARGTCDPANVAHPPYLWAGMPEDIVPMALTSTGARFIFDAIAEMSMVGPWSREIDDDELAELIAVLPRVCRLGLAEKRVRTALYSVLLEMRSIETDG